MTTDTLELVPAENPAEPPMKQLAPFSTLEQEARKMMASAEAIAILPPTAANAKVARTMRLEIKPLRVAVEKRHAELKRPILDAGNALDDGKNALLDLLKPMEASLLAIEQHAEREARRIEDELRAVRYDEMWPFMTAPISVDLGKIAEADYVKMLADAKDLATLREDRARKEKEAAAAQAKAEAEERERVTAENARLKQEADAREAQAKVDREAALAEQHRIQAEADAREKAAAEKARLELEAANKKAAEEARIAAEEARKQREAMESKAKAEKEAAEKLAKEAAEKARAEREEADRLAAIERKKIEDAAKAAAEQAKKEQAKRDAAAKVQREAAEALARQEREAREKLEAEIAAKKAADAKAESDRQEAARKAALAPAKEKLMTFAKEVRLLSLKTFDALNTADLKEVSDKAESFARWIEKKAAELGDTKGESL